MSGLTLFDAVVPPYVRPSMAEIRSRPLTGLTAVSTFSGCGGSSLGLRMAGWDVRASVEFIPAAAETYRANFPSTAVLEKDVRRVEPDDLLLAAELAPGSLDLLEGSPPCFPAGVPVLTAHGYVAIEDVRVGDSVLTHEGRWRPVTETHARPYAGRTTVLSIKYGRGPIEMTAEHPILVRRRSRGGDGRKLYGEPEWVAARTVRVGDVVLEPATKEGPPVPSHEVGYVVGYRWGEPRRFVRARPSRIDLRDEAVAWALGYYLAEGWRRGREPDADRPGATRREVSYACAPAEAEHAVDRLRSAGLRAVAREQSGMTALKISVSSADWWAACGEFGDGCAEKYVPEWAHAMPVGWRRQLLEGYLYGDGHDDGYARHAGTTSPRLAQDLLRLVPAVYGVAASVMAHEARPWQIEGRTGESRPSWTVSFRSELTGRSRPGFVDAAGCWLTVRAVAHGVTAPTTVYNLEVEEDHSYVAAGIASHNCASFSQAGMRERGWETVKRYSDTEQRTDDLFWEWVRLLGGLRPRAFLAENVPGLLAGNALEEYAHKITRDLSALGYRVGARVMNSANFGVPQERRRLILLGYREDVAARPEFPAATVTEPHTIAQALASVDPRDPDHRDYVPESSMVGKAVGRTWEWKRGLREKDLCARCDRPLPEHEFRDVTVGSVRKSKGREEATRVKTVVVCADGERGVEVKDYFLLTVPDLDRPCPTLTATGAQVGAASVVHPTECRKFTPAEAKAISGFPADFVLTGTREQRYERIGRTVTPPLYEAIGRMIARTLQEAER